MYIWYIVGSGIVYVFMYKLYDLVATGYNLYSMKGTKNKIIR
jgi:hypothetical protein